MIGGLIRNTARQPGDLAIPVNLYLHQPLTLTRQLLAQFLQLSTFLRRRGSLCGRVGQRDESLRRWIPSRCAMEPGRS
jgi:hypothetical protein